MRTTENTKDKWGLNTDLNKLTVGQRRDAVVLLHFLNEYGDTALAFEKLKSNWIDMIYKLPETSAPNYGAVKTGRYNILSRMRRIFEDYLVELPPEE